MSDTPGTSAKEVLDSLKRVEDKEVSGLRQSTPKQRLLDASDVQKKFPQKRVRWVSSTFSEKMESRKMEGYEVVPEKDGGRRVGGLVLMFCPIEVHKERVRSIERLNAERLQLHTREMQGMAEGEARRLRNQHGIKVDAKDLLINEG